MQGATHGVFQTCWVLKCKATGVVLFFRQLYIAFTSQWMVASSGIGPLLKVAGFGGYGTPNPATPRNHTVPNL